MEFQSDIIMKFCELTDVPKILIFSYLPLREKINAKDVCSHWKSIIQNSSSLWKESSSMDIPHIAVK